MGNRIEEENERLRRELEIKSSLLDALIERYIIPLDDALANLPVCDDAMLELISYYEDNKGKNNVTTNISKRS